MCIDWLYLGDGAILTRPVSVKHTIPPVTEEEEEVVKGVRRGRLGITDDVTAVDDEDAGI